MKKIQLILIWIFMLCFSGCMSLSQSPLDIDIPETVEIEGEIYRTGFYGDDLWVKNMEFTGTEYEVNGTQFRGLDCNGFTCVQAPHLGGKTNGILYCLDAQWEDAAAYYGNPENFIYYCEIEATSYEPERLAELEDIDLEQWDTLLQQGNAYSYDPFDQVKNKAVEFHTVDFDTLEINPLPYIHFYRESKDEKFKSSTASHFFVWDGVLYLGRYHNQSEHRLSTVEIPADTAAYFLEIIENVRS